MSQGRYKVLQEIVRSERDADRYVRDRGSEADTTAIQQSAEASNIFAYIEWLTARMHGGVEHVM